MRGRAGGYDEKWPGCRGSGTHHPGTACAGIHCDSVVSAALPKPASMSQVGSQLVPAPVSTHITASHCSTCFAPFQHTLLSSNKKAYRCQSCPKIYCAECLPSGLCHNCTTPIVSVQATAATMPLMLAASSGYAWIAFLDEVHGTVNSIESAMLCRRGSSWFKAIVASGGPPPPVRRERIVEYLVHLMKKTLAQLGSIPDGGEAYLVGKILESYTKNNGFAQHVYDEIWLDAAISDRSREGKSKPGYFFFYFPGGERWVLNVHRSRADKQHGMIDGVREREWKTVFRRDSRPVFEGGDHMSIISLGGFTPKAQAVFKSSAAHHKGYVHDGSSSIEQQDFWASIAPDRAFNYFIGKGGNTADVGISVSPNLQWVENMNSGGGKQSYYGGQDCPIFELIIGPHNLPYELCEQSFMIWPDPGKLEWGVGTTIAPWQITRVHVMHQFGYHPLNFDRFCAQFHIPQEKEHLFMLYRHYDELFGAL